MRIMAAGLATAVLLVPLPVPAAPLSVELVPAPGNAATPRMGDHLTFHATIRNDGTTLERGVIAWISLIQADPGQVQPIDLEDWSAQKAVTVPALAPGDVVESDWPMRLIQSGHYRVAVTVTSGTGEDLASSRLVAFTVREKPVVESHRVLPVALGIPALIGLTFLRRRRRPPDG